MNRLSVIISVYNSERFLTECLDSVKNQTLRDLEIICVDDGSTDRSGSICDQYALQDERFTVIHQANSGPSAARNRGFDAARGDYVAFLDADDSLEPNAYETAMAHFASEETDGETDIVQFLFRMFDGNGTITKTFPKIKQTNTDYADRLNCMTATMHVVWNKIYRRAFLFDNNIRFQEGCRFEDVPFVHQCAFLAKRIDAYSDILYNYRIGLGYSTGQNGSYWKIELIRMYDLLYKIMSQYDLNDVQKEYFQTERLSAFRTVYRKLIPPSLRPQAREMILERLDESDWRFLEADCRFAPRKRAFFYWLAGRSCQAVRIFVLAKLGLV